MWSCSDPFFLSLGGSLSLLQSLSWSQTQTLRVCHSHSHSHNHSAFITKSLQRVRARQSAGRARSVQNCKRLGKKEKARRECDYLPQTGHNLVCMYMYARMCVCVCVCVRIYIYIYIYIYINIWLEVWLRSSSWTQPMANFVRIYGCMYMYVCMYIHIIYIYIYIYIYSV
jgi:hypothetical protein